MLRPSVTVAFATVFSIGCSVALSTNAHRPSPRALISRALVWTPTNVAAHDMLHGPVLPNGFSPGESVRCDYVQQPMSGRSPKFACRVGADDVVKVKFGGTNGEVYAEVAATR